MPHRLIIAAPAAAVLLFAGFWIPPAPPSEYDSARLMEQGLRLEAAGDLPGAAQSLLAAARADRLYQPRWTLANFYFRHGQETEFWRWSHEALAVGSRDLGALFDLCWHVSDNAGKIWSRVIPDRPPVWNEYLLYLTASGKWPAAGSAASRIAETCDSSALPLLTDYFQLAIPHGALPAKEAWDRLCRRRLLPYRPDELLTNGDLRVMPTAIGFDWTVPRVAGVRHEIVKGEARFTLDGSQPEEAELLTQPLALEEGTGYALRFEANVTGQPSPSGLSWRAAGARGESLSGSGWVTGEVRFTGAPGTVALVYKRIPGTTIFSGTVALRRMEIKPQ